MSLRVNTSDVDGVADIGTIPDTPRGLKPHGFSVRPRRYPRESPKALPAPFYILGGIVVPVETRPTVRAAMPANRQALLDRTPQPEQVWLVNAGSTASTVLPAFAALKFRMARNADHPASCMDFARWWFLTMLRTCKSS